MTTLVRKIVEEKNQKKIGGKKVSGRQNNAKNNSLDNLETIKLISDTVDYKVEYICGYIGSIQNMVDDSQINQTIKSVL